LLNSQIVQTAREHHGQIREVILGVAEYIFDDAGTFDTRDGMFDPHAHSRDALIVKFLCVRQFTIARLFLGWQV